MAGIYVHVPFCASKCAYCDFYSAPGRRASEMAAYVDCVITEWRRREGELRGEAVETVYIGGGTPSLLPPDELARMLEALPAEGCCEVTVEANPEQVTAAWLDALGRTPVNRVSMGVQSFSDAELKAVGRRHTSAQALEAIGLLQSAEWLRSWSIDLIYGLPGQTRESWRDNLAQVAAMRPPHLSAYMLSYEKGTRLDAMRIAGKVAPHDDETLCAMYDDLCRAMADAGYEHYEISNFALPGHRAVHNSNYWLDRPYTGLGPGAHSFDGRARRFNPPALKRYLDAGGAAEPELEEETLANRINDHIMVALRTSRGVARERFAAAFGLAEWRALARRMRPYVATGQLLPSSAPDSWRIAEGAWLVSDAIIADLLTDPD